MTGADDLARATSADADAIVALMQRVYGGTPIGREFADPLAARERWVHVNTRQPGVNDVPAWVARADGRIVGHVGAVEADAVIESRARRVAWARDLAVDPDARGSGLGSRLISHLVATYDAVLLGGMNARVRRIYRRLGYRENGDLPFYVSVRRPWDAARAIPAPAVIRPLAAGVLAVPRWWRSGRRPSGDPGVREVRSFDGFDEWWASVEPSWRRVIRRSAALMSWRYLTHPTHAYRIYAASTDGRPRGWAVIRAGVSRGLPAGFVVELLVAQGDVAAYRELLAAVDDDLSRGSAVFDRCVVLDPEAQRALVRAGWLRAPSPIGWMVAGRSRQDGAFDRRGWMLNGGDSDFDLI